MQRRLTLALTFLALPCLATSTATVADKLAFSPAAGSVLSRVWSVSSEATLDDMQISSNGNPMPMPMEMEMSQTSVNSIEVTDTIAEMRAGAPKQLTRKFDKLSGDGSVSMTMGQMGDQSRDMNATSELEGKTVKFAWNEEDGAYEISYAEGEGDAELLEKLAEDMDLRGLLPEKEVSAGDTWAPSPNALRVFVAPGGGLSLKPQSTDEGSGFAPGMDQSADLSSLSDAEFEGDVSAEYKGIREVDGVKLGEIVVTFDISSAVDMTEEAAEMAQDLPEGMGTLEVERLDLEFTWKGEATILWDVASGHVVSAEAQGEQSLRIDTGMAMSMGGQNMNLETEIEMSGKLDSTLKVTRE